MLRCIFITGYFRVRADLFVSFLWEVTNIKRAECCSIDYVQYCDHSLPFQAAAITVNCRDDHSDADKLLKLSNADKLKLLKSNANSEQIYLRIAFPCHSLSACLLATENSMKIFNNASEHYCSFSFSNPISSRLRGSNILKSSWMIILFGALIQIENFVPCWLLPFYLFRL